MIKGVRELGGLSIRNSGGNVSTTEQETMPVPEASLTSSAIDWDNVAVLRVAYAWQDQSDMSGVRPGVI